MGKHHVVITVSIALLLSGCGLEPPKIAVGKYPDMDADMALVFTSHDDRFLKITKIVINHRDDPDCSWPAAEGKSEPHIFGTRKSGDVTDSKGPLYMGLGGGFTLMGYAANCGTPVEITIETNYGTADYEYTGQITE